MKKLLLTLLSATIIVGAYFISSYFTAEEIPAEASFMHGDMPVRVEVAVAVRQPLRETITYPGSVAADETVSISPKVSGIIEAIFVEFGQFVKQGDPLVELDDSEFVERLKQAEANLQLSKAQLSRTETQYQLAERELERAERSGKQGISSEQALDTSQAARDSALAEVEVARAEVQRMLASVEEAQLNVANTRIQSPLEGWVQAREFDPGALASPSSPILTIVDTDPAEVVVYVPEKEFPLASVGRTAMVSAGRGMLNFEGTIQRVAPSLSMSTRTTEVVIMVPNPNQELRPGMSADVTLVAREDANALVVPSPALVFREGNMQAFRVVDGKAVATTVEVGIEQDGVSQIVSGLNEGDKVIVKGQFMINDGQSVDDGSGGNEGRGWSGGGGRPSGGPPSGGARPH